MKYQNAKDVYDELKNFEGKVTFQGEETIIEFFVLLPEKDVASLDIKKFIATHTASSSFEIEGSDNEEYTIIGINTATPEFSDDIDYFQKLLVW